MIIDRSSISVYGKGRERKEERDDEYNVCGDKIYCCCSSIIIVIIVINVIAIIINLLL